MQLHWQISVGQLFDLLFPAAYALALVCSAWVLADARRRGVRPLFGWLWALASFLLPPTVLPLYLLARLWSPAAVPAGNLNPADTAATAPTSDIANMTDERATANAEIDTEGAPVGPAATRRSWAHRRPVILYATALATVGAFYFYHDYRSLAAHLARGSSADLRGQHERAAREYRAALRLKPDPHTHKLLGLELARTNQWADALAAFRAAAQGGEPDAALPYYSAHALDALNRPAEARSDYENFLAGPLCTQPPPDARCAQVQTRLHRGSDTPAAK